MTCFIWKPAKCLRLTRAIWILTICWLHFGQDLESFRLSTVGRVMLIAAARSLDTNR